MLISPHSWQIHIQLITFTNLTSLCPFIGVSRGSIEGPDCWAVDAPQCAFGPSRSLQRRRSVGRWCGEALCRRRTCSSFTKRCDRFKACQKTQLPLLWVSCGNLLTYQLLLLHLKCSIITHRWSWSTRTWRGIAKCLAEGLPDGSQQWRCLGRLGGYRFSALGHFKEARFDQHLKRKNQRKGKTKDEYDVFCFRPKVCLIQVYITDAIEHSVPRFWDANSRQNAVMSMSWKENVEIWRSSTAIWVSSWL